MRNNRLLFLVSMALAVLHREPHSVCAMTSNESNLRRKRLDKNEVENHHGGLLDAHHGERNLGKSNWQTSAHLASNWKGVARDGGPKKVNTWMRANRKHDKGNRKEHFKVGGKRGDTKEGKAGGKRNRSKGGKGRKSGKKKKGKGAGNRAQVPECDPDCPCCDKERWPEFVAAVESFDTGKECYSREDDDGSNIVALVTCEPARNVAYMSYDYSGVYPTVPYCGDSRSKRNFLTRAQGAACEVLVQAKVHDTGATCTDKFPDCDDSPQVPSCSPTTGVCVDNFSDLQLESSNAQPGDVIALCGGTMTTESAIVIDQPNMTLCCLENTGCVMQSGGTDRNLMVVGESFTLQGIGFFDGSADGADGGNVLIDANGDHRIRGCNFFNGTGADYGGNLFVDTADSIRMEFSVFVNGQAGFGGGAAVYNAADFSTFECEFLHNSGGGIFSGNLDSELRDPGQDIAFEKSIFFNNSGGFGGGFLATGIGSLPKLTVSDCDFSENAARGGGAGAVFPDASVIDLRLSDNSGSGNVAETECDGILIYGDDKVCYDVADEVP